MNPATWDLEEEPEGALPQQASALASLHFVRSALRRRRRAIIFSGIVGVLAALAVVVAMPAAHHARATLVLSHDPASDPADAMATDASLAVTRDVAQQAITALRLPISSQDLLDSITVEQTTTDVLTIELAAASDQAATSRLAAFTSAYLAFRSTQLSAQSDALIKGLNGRIDGLQAKADTLTSQIDRLAAIPDAASNTQLNDAVTQRAQIVSQISTLQESVQDSAVRTAALIASSRVIDAPEAEPYTGKRRAVILVAGGMIGGLGLACGLVVLLAITSDRIRLRSEVTALLEVAIAASVRRIRPLYPWLRTVPLIRMRDARRTADRRRAAGAILSAMPAASPGQWLAVGCIDNAREMVCGVAEAALTVHRKGMVIRLIDLTEGGHLTSAVAALEPVHDRRVPVLRPTGKPYLVSDLGQIQIYGPRTREMPVVRETDVFLAVADLRPEVGAEHLAAWTNRVMVAVTSGASSAERLRTTADMIHAAGLTLWSAILLETETTDNSSGVFGGAGIQAASPST